MRPTRKSKQYVTSLRVTRGFHTIYVPLRAKTKHNFQCSISQRTPSKSFILHAPHFLPQIWNRRLISGYVALPVTNLLVSKWLRVSKVSVLDSSHGLSAKLLDKRVTIAPGQTLSVRVEGGGHWGHVPPSRAKPVFFFLFFHENCARAPPPPQGSKLGAQR